MPKSKDNWAPTRSGQWVRFKPKKPIDGAHEAGEMLVGIFQAAGTLVTPPVVDEQGKVTNAEIRTQLPARVNVVKPDGSNLMQIGTDDDGNQRAENVALSVEQIDEWAPVTDWGHLPEKRRPKEADRGELRP